MPDPEPVKSLDTLVQETVSADTEFNNSIANLPENEREEAISNKTAEVRQAKFAEISESNAKNAELAKNQKIRAEKAEKGNGKGEEGDPAPKEGEGAEPEGAPAKEDNLSSDNIFALMEAKVPREDVAEVVRLAKVLEKTIPEALQDATVISVLKTRADHRTTAEAANTGPALASGSNISDEKILEDFHNGKVPEAGTPEAQRLFLLRRKKN